MSRSSWRSPVLKAGKFRCNKKKLFGFDIETYSDKNNFLCASVVGEDGWRQTYFTKEDLINGFQHSRFRNSLIVATNLSFDFFGVFDKSNEIQSFKTLFRGSSLLFAKSHLGVNNKFFLKTKKEEWGKTVTFIDTLNYAGMSVHDMGNILGYEKLDLDGKIGLIPENKKEVFELINYNIRDCEISLKFMKFLYDGFEDLGASPKLTIASTAMSLFRNKYLKDKYYLQNTDDILEIMQGYYGGRTEAFKRGVIREGNYYDINSMYPSAMTKRVPNPNTHRVTHKNVLDYIYNYEGMSKVSVFCPDMKIPLLPYRTGNKLIFPTGNFSGWYTHVELRKALSLGYVIKKVHKTHYYKETCEPLKDYALELYETRKTAKKQKNKMQLVYKLLLNSLYGKFGQRFLDREEYTPISNFTLEQIREMKDFERLGDFIKHKKDSEPSHFCIPIWASYITSYSRLMLYDYLSTCDPYYCDTDSIITLCNIEESDELGKMKLEMKIKEGIIIKPKMYAVISDDNKEIVKIKGVKKKVVVGDVEVSVDYNFFLALEEDSSVEYRKFVKFKESMRRGLKVNEIIPMIKELDLDDNKRVWCGELDWNKVCLSSPHEIVEGMTKVERERLKVKTYDAMKDEKEAELQKFFDSDLWDSRSVGSDISDKEFLKNELSFELE